MTLTRNGWHGKFPDFFFLSNSGGGGLLALDSVAESWNVGWVGGCRLVWQTAGT